MKYKLDYIFPAKDNGKVIRGTALVANETKDEKFASKYAEPNRLTSRKDVKVSSKVVSAIIEAEKTTGHILVARDNLGARFFVGIIESGSVGPQVIIVPENITEENTVIASKNVTSHYLFSVMLAKERFLYPKDEFDLLFRKLDLSGEIVDSNQTGVLVKMMSNLITRHARPLVNMNVEQDENICIGYLKGFNFEFNITPFLNSKYEAPSSTTLEVLEGAPISMPEIILKPEESDADKAKNKKKSAKQQLKEYKNRDFSVFTKEEIAAMPEILQIQHKIARDTFLANKDFLTLQDWMTIEAMYEGDIKNICFLGPAGVGKTTVARTYAGAMNRPFVLIGGSANLEESAIFGYERITKVEGCNEPVMVMNKGLATLAIEHGALMLFDEINTVPAGVVSKFNTLLDDTKAITLDNGEVVQAHEKFIFAEAMNIGAGYNGTGQMNLSHFDRMDHIVKLVPKTAKEEAKIVESVTGYHNLTHLEKMCQLKNDILAAIEAEGDAAEQITSIRRVISWVKMAARTGEFLDSAMNTILAHLVIYDEEVNVINKEKCTQSTGMIAGIFDLLQSTFSDDIFSESEYDKYTKKAG